jgi:2-haloacid dehalogenase
MQAFQTLKAAGIHIFALSNGALATSQKILEKASLIAFVERVISVEDIRVFKPRREIYLHAAQIVGVAPADMMLIATHAWDVHGAKRAGLLAGFVARGQQFPATMEAPDVTGESLLEVAKAITD